MGGGQGPPKGRSVVISILALYRRCLAIDLTMWFQLRSLSHPNLNVFLGVCLSGPVCILWQHCAKGSLKVSLHQYTCTECLLVEGPGSLQSCYIRGGVGRGSQGRRNWGGGGRGTGPRVNFPKPYKRSNFPG